jgi:hypothetical protein
MQREYVIEKLVSALRRLSDEELYALSQLLRYSDVAHIFGEIVDRMIRLRGIERERRPESRVLEGQNSRKPSRASRMGVTEPVEARFFNLLNDRQLFPSTKDVVDVLNDVFNLGLRYEDYVKHGRRDLIQRCWNHLQAMPVNERRRLLRVLSERGESQSAGSEGYHELFRILSQK